VGWQAGDVEDTLKKIEGDKAQPAVMAAQQITMAQKPSVQVVQPASSSAASPISKPSSPFASFSPSDIIGGTKNGLSQPARMNDVASPAQNQTKNFFDKKSVSTERVDAGKMNNAAKMMGGASEYPPKTKGGKVLKIVEAVVIVGLAALSGFLYFQNSALSAKVNGLGGQSTDVASQIANLTAQVQAFTTSDANLNTQVSSLSTENADLQTNLSFVAIPISNPSSTASVATTTEAQVSGILHGGSASYTLTTSYGVKVYVKNSSDVKVSAALAPLVGTNVQLSGTHLVGSANLTVTSVNGVSLLQNVAPTTTQSSSSTTTTTTP
jgi:hypothetical protein